ncbi:lymphocyte antigen 6E-like [Elgaria multicarinata webbii]|uniref:lymphocyte antigen 6E-like n=1 Tax=Elgaria multicarinata webbii TaxID=159646 RepID=UPI002FCD215A
MKAATFLLSLLGAVVVCTQIADSIICFTCEGQTSNWNCLGVTTCPEHQQRCLTIGTTSGTGNDTKVHITKKCAEKCPTERNSPSNSLFCCESSLCNLWPPK